MNVKRVIEPIFVPFWDFILEDHVLNTGNGLITRAILDDMWTMALSKIVSALQTHSVGFVLIILHKTI